MWDIYPSIYYYIIYMFWIHNILYRASRFNCCLRKIMNNEDGIICTDFHKNRINTVQKLVLAVSRRILLFRNVQSIHLSLYLLYMINVGRKMRKPLLSDGYCCSYVFSLVTVRFYTLGGIYTRLILHRNINILN